jgi:transcriptional regulator with XRE-family HTH domain
MKQPDTITPFGAFVRLRRQQCDPQDFDVPTGRRRRTTGLRREELAQLCGISITWLTWIEQGRAASVSAPTLLALARGLRLTRAEREYLFRLAGKSDPAPPSDTVGDRRVLRQLVDGFGDPAYVLDRYWDAVVWNRAATRLFPHWLQSQTKAVTARAADRAAERANLLHYVFLNPAARRQVVDWKQRAQRLVAEYRADTATLRGDALRDAFVEELARRSTEFATLWRAERVQAREGGERRFRDSRGRICRFEQVTLRLARQPELKLVLLISSAKIPITHNH